MGMCGVVIVLIIKKEINIKVLPKNFKILNWTFSLQNSISNKHPSSITHVFMTPNKSKTDVNRTYVINEIK